MDKLKGQSIIAKSEVRRLYRQGAHEYVRDVALRLMEEKHDLERQLAECGESLNREQRLNVDYFNRIKWKDNDIEKLQQQLAEAKACTSCKGELLVERYCPKCVKKSLAQLKAKVDWYEHEKYGDHPEAKRLAEQIARLEEALRLAHFTINHWTPEHQKEWNKRFADLDKLKGGEK